jgi:tRNA pseudouridine55 synthase
VHGFLLIDKPVGPSSHSAVQKVRKTLGFGGKRGTKAGHAGTLDPFASGLLIVLIGGATRLMPYVVGHDKRYLVGIRFGASSTTDDLEGDLRVSDAAPPSRAQVEAALTELAAATEQVPPAVSALHIDGKRAYQRVRRGETVIVPPRPVRFDSIDVVEWQEAAAEHVVDVDGAPLAAGPRIVLDVRCGTGTYMRALARDLGDAVGCPAFCDELRRTEVGEWTLAGASAPDVVAVAELRDPLDLIPHIPRERLTSADVVEIVFGRRLPATDDGDDGLRALVGPDGAMVALATRRDGQLHPQIVLLRTEELPGE